MKRHFVLALALAAALPACSGTPASNAPSGTVLPAAVADANASPIKHVVIIVQENRSFDNFFSTFPGADGTLTGQTHDGKTVRLKKVPLRKDIDLGHNHGTFLAEYAGGKMNGFDTIGLGGTGGLGPAGTYPYQYVDPNDIAPYWSLAKQYVLADRTFASQSSGSFTAHQYLIAGGTEVTPKQSVIDFPSKAPWGCDAPKGTVTSIMTVDGRWLQGQGPFPCFTYRTLRDSLNERHVSWKYYTPLWQGAGELWNAFDAISAARYSDEWTSNVSRPETNIFSDISGGNLPAVSWVVPEFENSDHPWDPGNPLVEANGPSWVASIVNAVGANKTLWNSTAIVIVWDDWGGYYDHVAPTQIDAQGFGFRVPMIVVSPYAKAHYVDHTQYEFGSILKFVENTFALPRIGTTDVRATGLKNAFDFTKPPRAFVKIQAKHDRNFFLHQRPSNQPVDDE